MKLTILILLLSFGLGFFSLAYFQQEARRGGYAMLSGFIVLMITGLLVSGFGLEYKAGEDITAVFDAGTNTTTTQMQYSYESVTTIENTLVGLPLILAGFWGMMIVIGALRETRGEE